MRSFHSQSADVREARPIRYRAVVVGICLVFPAVLGSAKSASASCGDWLVHPSGDTLDSGASRQSGPSSPLQATEKSDSREGQGPNCSGGCPLPLDQQPATPGTTSKVHVCAILVGGASATELRDFFAHPVSIGSPTRVLSRVERPPAISV